MAGIDDKKCYVYEPTTAELKLLEVLCTPEYTTLNITEKCNMAQISIPTYYRAMEKEGFKALIKKAGYELVVADLLPIIKATIKYAIGNPNGTADRKLLLQLADMVTEKSEINGKIEMPQIIITK